MRLVRLPATTFVLAALALWPGLAAQADPVPVPPPPGSAPGAAPGAAAPGPAAAAAPGIAWEQDYAAALQRAAAEKKPIFVAFLMDNEPANDQTIKDHYKDPQILKLLGRFVCLVGCLGEHPGEGGCAKFPGLSCQHHREVEKSARAKWLVGDEVCTPQHVFCDPQGNVLRRKVYLITKATLARNLLLTLTDCGVDTRDLQVKYAEDPEGDLVEMERARVSKWLTDLDSKNLEVRETALRGLGWADDPRAMPAVLERCHTKYDDQTRLAAIGALARKGNWQAVPKLVLLLAETKAQVLTAVASTLETIQMPEAAPALLTAIRKEKRDRVLGGLLRAAARSQPKAPETRDQCLKHLKAASAQLMGHILVALGHLEPHDKIVTAVAPQLASKTQGVRGLAVWVLGAMRTPAALKLLQGAQAQEKVPEILKVLRSAVSRCRGEHVEGYDSLYYQFFYDFQ